MGFSFLGSDGYSPCRWSHYHCHCCCWHSFLPSFDYHEHKHVLEVAAQHGKQGMSYAESTKEQYSQSGKYGCMASLWLQSRVQTCLYKLDSVNLSEDVPSRAHKIVPKINAPWTTSWAAIRQGESRNLTMKYQIRTRTINTPTLFRRNWDRTIPSSNIKVWMSSRHSLPRDIINSTYKLKSRIRTSPPHKSMYSIKKTGLPNCKSAPGCNSSSAPNVEVQKYKRS
ncbi:hypothetical protein Lal_00024947 [Lupinus albus]|nr:hypothetical protein Lal_00024947 [Lupinus albus]